MSEATPHTLVMTDGFSCRSQIDHGENRSALHLAQVIQMALHEGPNGPAAARPETRYSKPPAAEGVSNRTQAAAGVIAAAALGGTGALARRRRRERGSRLAGSLARRVLKRRRTYEPAQAER